MENITKYRNEIDSIDKELIALFERRMDIARLIAEYKKENAMEIFHPGREEDVLNKCIADLHNKDYEEYVVELVKDIMDISKKFQFNTIK